MTTRWSIVLSCAESGTDQDKAHKALAELCKIYWRPVFAFICRQGHSVPDAQDSTQDFFAKVLKGRLLQGADRNRGRFRSLLLTALQRFLHDEVEKRHAHKRGGDLRFVSWDDWMGDECEKRGRRRVFDVLSSCLAAERQDVSYATLARILGLRETAVKPLVHRMRDRYRTLLREEVAQTVGGANEIDDELRYLCAALSAAK
ncbi:MAG: hypothetical protein DMF01_05390 [Verrucomicrobia bacterium]|nr:MAG: hypothetical protein DMF01_05390 [Verrucomicrobiota bacterium]